MNLVKKYGWILAIILIAGVIYLQTPRSETSKVVNQQSDFHKAENEVKDPEIMKVDVKGEVVRPGVYSVQSGTRVDDVIKEAGGLTSKADASSVNLAQKLQDEMVIHVTSLIMNGEGSPSQIDVASTKISINRATADEIESLNGIGPSKAAAIVQYREENGPFSSVEDLVEVPGIGEKTVEAFKDKIRVP
ncbi:helix-hairpin-helix domain-containing protein [Halobacillus sp. H74]|uniref:helix-hairpin-helix domain-containing protein n=1 Tax=Halobacillus sp. H74 TaxID=3457436 RepID=UPI003FCCDBDA